MEARTSRSAIMRAEPYLSAIETLLKRDFALGDTAKAIAESNTELGV